MHRSIKHYLTLGAILTGICSMGQTGLAATVEPGLKITLHVSNYAHVESETLDRAKQEATRIFREIGVETLWLDQSLLPKEDQQDSAPHRISEIYLNIVPRAADGLGVLNNSLGLAPGAGRGRGRLYVFYDRVEGLYHKQIAATARGKIPRSATTAQILGYAMAHEIGHLLGLDAHSSVGIMRAEWRMDDVLNLAYGDLAFTPRQAAVIRGEVRMRQQANLGVAEPQGLNLSLHRGRR